MKKTAWKFLKIFTMIGVFAFLLAEVTFRVFYSEKLKLQAYPLIYTPDKLTGYRYIPNTKTKISVPSIEKEFVINKNGYYGPSFQLEKEANSFRIALVGASIETGIWLNAKENYAMKLEKLFRQEGYRAEVVNFSVDGKYRDLQNIELVKEEVVKYKPDLILMTTKMPFIDGFVYREIYKGYVLIYDKKKYALQSCKDRIDYIESHKLLTNLYNLSYVVRAMGTWYSHRYRNIFAENLSIFMRKRYQQEGIYFLPMASNKSAIKLQELHSSLEKEGIAIYFFQYARNEFYQEMAMKYELPYFELNMPKDGQLLHEYDAHYNEQGHSLLSQQLFKQLNSLTLDIPKGHINQEDDNK